MMKRIVLTLGILISIPASAIVFGGTNLGFMGYPSPSCHQPYSPNQYELDSYRTCIEAYVEAARADSKRAIEAANDAVAEYNTFVRSL